MRDIKINITAEHIRDGVPGSACFCPIALALKDTLLTENVVVNSSGMRVNQTCFDMEPKDLKFIKRFDNGEPVKPYSFSLQRKRR